MLVRDRVVAAAAAKEIPVAPVGDVKNVLCRRDIQVLCSLFDGKVGGIN